MIIMVMDACGHISVSRHPTKNIAKEQKQDSQLITLHGAF